MRFCVPLPLPPAPGGASTGAGAGTGAATTEIGGKARSLVRLAAAGLRVPPAFAIGTALFRALRAASGDALDAAPFPAGFRDELDACLTAVAGGDDRARFSVRSSFNSEDQPGALAAGVFESRVDVARDELEAAIRAVLASAGATAAIRYAREHAIDVDSAGMAVLVHPFIGGDAAGSAAWDPLGATPPIIDGLDATDEAAVEIEAALRALARTHGAIEVEWVKRAGAITYLQMRPFDARGAGATGGARVDWTAVGGGDWRWDASHNPLPLSPAQAGLIALCDQRCRIGVRQRVVNGYLFFQRSPVVAGDGASGAEGIGARLAATRARVDEALERLGPAAALPAALDVFVDLYQIIFGQLQPAARRARQALRDFLRAHGLGDDAALAGLLADVPSVATERRARAAQIGRARTAAQRAVAVWDYLGRFGDETPVWDVAAPTFAEDSRLVAAAAQVKAPGLATSDADAQAAAWRARLPARDGDVARFDFLLGEARAAVAAGEEDDLLYARAQAAVRRALLREGHRLHARGIIADAGDVFWLPLAATLDDASGRATLAPATAARLVATARAADAIARVHPPPTTGAGSGDANATAVANLIVGRPGSGGRVVGRAFLYPDPGGALPDDTSIVVARAILPTELPLLAAAGLVTETGGVLGHVAAQARERGIPAVVDAAGATARVRPGDRLLLDGDTGTVVKL
ncbi:MAG TPA: PEP/pyruvate-binding domain-containing protein [Polyangia bacterium]|nr:PEP/pyruvate-binding domain-containing protein [Polyangia bacterium]